MSIGIGSSMNEPREPQALTFRPGLPPQASSGRFIGLASGGRVFVLRWSRNNQVWQAVGFEAPRSFDVDSLPLALICQGDMADYITHHASIDD